MRGAGEAVYKDKNECGLNTCCTMCRNTAERRHSSSRRSVHSKTCLYLKSDVMVCTVCTTPAQGGATCVSAHWSTLCFTVQFFNCYSLDLFLKSWTGIYLTIPGRDTLCCWSLLWRSSRWNIPTELTCTLSKSHSGTFLLLHTQPAAASL